MQSKLNNTRKKFTLWIVLFAIASVLALGFALYESNVIKFGSDINSDKFNVLVENNPDLVAYLESQKDYEAHFVSVANIIKDDQQQELGEAMILITIPILIVVTIVGYFVAKKLLEPVEEAYEAQERFIQDAAHELRNPLATMSAVIQNAKTINTNDNKKFKLYVKQMERQVKRLSRINEDLLYLDRQLDYSGSSSSNISELMLDVIEDLQPQASDKSIKLNVDIAPDIHENIAAKDFVRLSRNLLDNAIKYSKSSSKEVKVKLSKEGKGSKLVVQDSGIGIPREDLEQIGERFFRASNTGKHDGTGLGISIVYKIVNEYGLSVDIDSTASKGTKVSVKF